MEYSKEEIYKNKLLDVAADLEKWADESLSGGWSTHQVKPMRQKAGEIYRLIAKNISK